MREKLLRNTIGSDNLLKSDCSQRGESGESLKYKPSYGIADSSGAFSKKRRLTDAREQKRREKRNNGRKGEEEREKHRERATVREILCQRTWTPD